MNPRAVTLFIAGYKGLTVLQKLSGKFYELIDSVIIDSDINVQKDYYEEIKKHCQNFKIKWFCRKDIYDINSGYAIAIGWRWLIDLPSTRLIVFHDSILPKYRGYNPLVTYLINGEKKIGATALFATPESDTGDIIAQSTLFIQYPIKIAEAINIMAEIYADLSCRICEAIAAGQPITGVKQNGTEATYSLWRDEEDYRIDWSLSAARIRRFIDAVGFPYKGALTLLKNKEYRIFEAEEHEDVCIENRIPGKVIFFKDSFPVVVCGNGLLLITKFVDQATGLSVLPLKKIRTRLR